MPEKIPIRKGIFTKVQDRGALLANKCKSCGQIFFPKTVLCLSCLREDMEEIVLSEQGILYSYTIAHMPSMHFEPPYAVGYVDMPEGVRIFTPLNVVEDKPFKIGMEMHIVIEGLWQEEDKEIIGYKFEPV